MIVRKNAPTTYSLAFANGSDSTISCSLNPTGACVYTKYVGDLKYYYCENGLTESECEDEHSTKVSFYEDECCDDSSTRIDNPDDCDE